MSDNAAPLLLLTRPRAASERFAAACRAVLGDSVEIRIAPLMEIAPTGDMPDLRTAAGLVFTSDAGVKVLAAATSERHWPVWCVGDRTAAAASEAGFSACSAGGAADDLVAMLIVDRPRGRLVHLHGRHVRGDVVARLRGAGLMAEGHAIYDQVALSPGADFRAALSHPGGVIVPLFSPRSATLFATAADGLIETQKSSIQPVVLSDQVREALPQGWRARCTIARHPDATSMITAIAAIRNS